MITRDLGSHQLNTNQWSSHHCCLLGSKTEEMSFEARFSYKPSPFISTLLAGT